MPWRPDPARLTLVLLLLATAATLAAGYAYKEDCQGERGGFDGSCYTDVLPLWGMRHFAEGATPYLDRAPGPVDDRTQHPGFLEYPIGTGVLMWLASRLTHAGTFGWPVEALSFLRWNALFLAPFALGTTWLLWRMTDRPWRPLVFALAPPLFVYTFHNWDIVAVFFLVLAIERLERGRAVESGIAIGLGGAAKLFPLVAAPLLFLLLWRRVHGAQRPFDVPALWRSLWRARDAWLFAGAVVGTLVVTHLPLLLAGGGPLYLEMFRFHAERAPNFESIWYVVRVLLEGIGGGWTYGEEGAWPTVTLVVLYAAAAVWAWWRRAEPRAVVFVSLFPLLVTNVFFSVQYVLWLLPFFALLRLPLWSYALLLVADRAVYVTLFGYFDDFAEGRPTDFLVVAWTVVAREVVFFLVAGLAMTRRFGRSTAPSEVASAPEVPAAPVSPAQA